MAAGDQCRVVDSTVNYVANISSTAKPYWGWDHDHLHAAAAGSSWPWQTQQLLQPNPNSNSSCDEDVSNQSSLSVDSSRRLMEQRSTSSNDDLNNIGEHVSDNQIWSQVLLSDVGNSGLNLSSTAMYEPACDYLQKLDNASGNWEFTNSSAANLHASNINNFERQININRSFSNENLSNLVSTWSIAPPEPQVVSNPFFNHQVSCYGGAHSNNLMKVDSGSSQSGANSDYQIGLNNAMAADNSYYGNGLVMPPADSYSSSNTSARSFNDVIYFNSRLGKPTLMEHSHHAENPSSFKTSINLSSDSNSKKLHTCSNSPIKASGRGQVNGNESARKKKRTEESSTSSETVSKKPKQETSASSAKMQAPKVKVADKVTALQQIVSPFGKTDTASVLYEAIQYIKFLQYQIHVVAMSSPYLKTNSSKDPWGKFDQVIRGDHHVKVDLKSRGLCLMPTTCTLPQVLLENSGSDYWTTTYRGCLYRSKVDNGKSDPSVKNATLK